MDPIGTAGTGGITAATPLRVFLSHTADLGKSDEKGSFVAAVLRAERAAFGHLEGGPEFGARTDRGRPTTASAPISASPIRCRHRYAEARSIGVWVRGAWTRWACRGNPAPRPTGRCASS